MVYDNRDESVPNIYFQIYTLLFNPLRSWSKLIFRLDKNVSFPRSSWFHL